MIPWLLDVACAETPSVTAETLVQARTDLAGELFAGGIQALGARARQGTVELEAYGDLGFRSGFDQVFGGELYVLAADGESGPVTWTLGRQPLLLPTWNRRLDGGTARVALTGRWSIDAALGVASQPGSPGTIGGVPVARVAGVYHDGPLRVTAGAWGELAERPAVHGDLAARWAPDAGELAPIVSGTAAIGVRGSKRALERARIEATLRPTTGLRTHAWVERREPLPGTPLSADILSTFAPAGSDAAGLGAGWSTRNRHRLWGSASVQRWATQADPLVDEVRAGLVGELRWDPRCAAERWCASPSWNGIAGPGGALHRAGGALTLPLPASVDATVNASYVPYRERHGVWRSGAVAGATAVVRPAPGVGLEAGGDVFVGPTSNARAWLALQLAGGGR